MGGAGANREYGQTRRREAPRGAEIELKRLGPDFTQPSPAGILAGTEPFPRPVPMVSQPIHPSGARMGLQAGTLATSRLGGKWEKEL